MQSIPLKDLLPVLQLAIGPVILISGVGLLLLTITNRLGRVVDRARHLAKEQVAAAGAASGKVNQQIDVLNKRAGILRASCMMLGVTVLSAAVLILLLFVAQLGGYEFGLLLVVIFSIGQISLIGSVVAFLRDLNLALNALRLEINR